MAIVYEGELGEKNPRGAQGDIPKKNPQADIHSCLSYRNFKYI
jgi:hypothetical protein